MIKITKGPIKYVLLFNCFFLFSNITCTKKNTTEPEEQGIMGTVFDKQGNPLNNVEVHIMFNNLGDINYPSTHNKLYNSYQQKQTNMNLHQNYPNPFNLTTIIQFDVPADRDVQLKIFNWSDNNLVRDLIDEYKTAGTYQMVWDGRNDSGQSVTNGLYEYKLTIGGNLEEKTMCFNRTPESTFGIPLTDTDNSGKFFLAYTVLPLNEIIIKTSETVDIVGEATISSISIILIKEGFIPFSSILNSDYQSSVNLNYTLEEE